MSEKQAPDPVPNQAPDQAARHHPIYDQLADSAEFGELRKRYRGFVFPATIAFLSWYLLYVVLSNWAGGFMDLRVVGHINVALLFGLLQFATTFAIAYLYARYSAAKLDPLARGLEKQYQDHDRSDDQHGGGTR